MKLTVLVDVPGTTAGIVLPMLEQVGEGKLKHSDDWLSEVPHRMDDVEHHHEEAAGHSEVFAHHRYM